MRLSLGLAAVLIAAPARAAAPHMEAPAARVEAAKPLWSAPATGPLELTPLAASVVARAAAKDMPLSAVGAALRDSQDLDQAQRRLQELGLLARGEAGDLFPLLLRELWHEAEPSTPRPSRTDRGWPIPATVVESGGVEVRLHGINHGLAGHGSEAVLGLVERLEQARLPLYSEQALPQGYGYRYGRELMDHAVIAGLPVSIVPARAAPGQPLGSPLDRIFESMLISMASDAAAETPLAKGGALARRYAAQLAREQPDPDALRRLFMPLPLAFSMPWDALLPASRLDDLDRRIYPRSRAMAAAVLDEARREGLREVHLLTGFAHVDEIAWTLTRPR